MFHAHFVTKRRTFKHLNAYQRGQIEATLCLGMLAADECKKRKRHLVKIRAKAGEVVAEEIANLRELYGAQFSQVFRTITCDKGERVRASARSCSRGKGVLYSSLRSLGTWNEREAECARSVFHSEGHGYDKPKRGRRTACGRLDQYAGT